MLLSGSIRTKAVKEATATKNGVALVMKVFTNLAQVCSSGLEPKLTNSYRLLTKEEGLQIVDFICGTKFKIIFFLTIMYVYLFQNLKRLLQSNIESIQDSFSSKSVLKLSLYIKIIHM